MPVHGCSGDQAAWCQAVVAVPVNQTAVSS
jgi:hypothetical protein